jgi:hypothetical protein
VGMYILTFTGDGEINYKNQKSGQPVIRPSYEHGSTDLECYHYDVLLLSVA